MLRSFRAATLAIAIAFGACGCASVYHAREGVNADGYSDRQLGDARWRVEYIGDEIASRERVDDFLLLRAAEVTLANGYDWFAPSSYEGESEEELVIAGTPREHPSAWRPRWRERRSPFFWTDWRDPGPPEHVEEPARSYTVTRYAAREDIVLGRGEAPAGAFDARSVVARLAEERR